MSLLFSARKACEAAAVLLKAHPGERMEYIRLLKLLYACERESWKELGSPLLGGHLAALDHGPLHSEVYDLIKGTYRDQSFWRKHILTENYSVHLIADPEIHKLSQATMEILQRVAAEHLQQSEWEIVEWTHQFDEWKKNYREKTSTSIAESDLLLAVGFTKEEEEDVLADRRELEEDIAAMDGAANRS